MATKAYLTSEEFEEGRKLFLEASFATIHERQIACSEWLSNRLQSRLSQIEGWAESGPIGLGSWAREELAPRSDVDLILTGDEAAAGDFVREAQVQGIRIRSRLPADPRDWTAGVQPFDVLALLHARPFTPAAAAALKLQQEKIVSEKSWKRKILSAVRTERLERQKRHDSVSNFLEPNLKYGTGGLRDLQQALAIRGLFAEKFREPDEEAFAKISEAEEFLLVLRQMNHWLGGGDVLAAPFQPDIARLLGYANLGELMRELQIRLERGSFYADWVVEQVLKTKPPAYKMKWSRLISVFTHDASLSAQYEFRRSSNTIWHHVSTKERGRFLLQLFSRPREDKFWVAVCRSLCLEECSPEIKKVKGLTQHDHYHRYTVETHLYQTIREVDRIFRKPSQLHSLKSAASQLKPSDWAILKWTALFHDLGKGREKDHSTVGREMVHSLFDRFGFSKKFTDEIAWMVENHLLLTTAAFRQNANQPATWKRLFDRGITGLRLQRLMVFSAIDIRATNPDAWTSWKARLLADLYQSLASPTAVRHHRLFDQLRKRKLKVPLEDLDPFLVEALPGQALADDLKKMAQVKTDLPVLVKRHGAKQVWVRFHRRHDRPGLFLEFVQMLFASGAGIDAASVTTFNQYGVYDWFLVHTSRAPRDLAKRLVSNNVPRIPPVQLPVVRFHSVDVVSRDPEQWVLSFRGRDQKGLLLAAAKALFDLGLPILWARVHTWGSQIDDVFCVVPSGDLQNHLRLLRERLVT